MKKYLFYFIYLSVFLTGVLVQPGYAQNGEGNVWYFGEKAGLSFNSGTPVALTGSQLITQEGCASICDPNGNLLFYTNGITVWNRNHQAMPNGFGLLGDDSSTQSGVIVPKPGSPNIYYVFTVDLGSVGLAYSEVDMTLAGGLGDVVATAKNILLVNSTTEKLTAVGNAAGDGYWVIVHGGGNNRFIAYAVTAAGVDINNPVINEVGSNHNSLIGYMKISSNGKKLVAAVMSDNFAEVFDFNNATGTISNPIKVTLTQPYGVEFSPDNNKLYVASLCPGTVYQFDLNAGDATAVANSQINVGTSGTSCGGALQLAPDGKIYACRYQASSLSVINNPNVLGAGCGFADIGVSLASGTLSRIGLPTFVQSFFFTDPCAETNLRFFTVFRKSYVCTDCTDGKIAVNAIGGVPPIMYSINDAAFQPSGVFSNLAPGVYLIKARDANGCIISRTVQLNN